MNARSVTDVKLFNDIFSDCDKAYKEIKLDGLRIGYPKNFWEDIGEEVSVLSASQLLSHSTQLVYRKFFQTSTC